VFGEDRLEFVVGLGDLLVEQLDAFGKAAQHLESGYGGILECSVGRECVAGRTARLGLRGHNWTTSRAGRREHTTAVRGSGAMRPCGL